MKSLLKYCLSAAFLLGIFSCTKEMSQENGHNAIVQGDFYATIDGFQWDADSIQNVETNYNVTVLTGISKTGGQISMVLPGFKTGTYILNETSSPYAFYVNKLVDATAGYISNTFNAGGTVNITSIDTVNHLISGNFELTLIDPYTNKTVSVTKGVIAYVPYTVDSSPPVTTALDTLTAVVDGNNFVSGQVLTDLTSNQLSLGGISTDGTKSILLVMPGDITAGTYDMDFASGTYIGFYYPDADVTHVMASIANGKLTVVSNDTNARRIKGSFNFVATSTTGQTATIVTGYFSVSY
jgi:hypothetical protein